MSRLYPQALLGFYGPPATETGLLLNQGPLGASQDTRAQQELDDWLAFRVFSSDRRAFRERLVRPEPGARAFWALHWRPGCSPFEDDR